MHRLKCLDIWQKTSTLIPDFYTRRPDRSCQGDANPKRSELLISVTAWVSFTVKQKLWQCSAVILSHGKQSHYRGRHFSQRSTIWGGNWQLCELQTPVCECVSVCERKRNDLYGAYGNLCRLLFVPPRNLKNSYRVKCVREEEGAIFITFDIMKHMLWVQWPVFEAAFPWHQELHKA